MALSERQPAIKPSTTSPSIPGNGWTLPRAKRGSVIAANDDTSRANSAGTMDDGTADAGIAHLPHHLRPTSRLCKDPGCPRSTSSASNPLLPASLNGARRESVYFGPRRCGCETAKLDDSSVFFDREAP